MNSVFAFDCAAVSGIATARLRFVGSSNDALTRRAAGRRRPRPVVSRMMAPDEAGQRSLFASLAARFCLRHYLGPTEVSRRRFGTVTHFLIITNILLYVIYAGAPEPLLDRFGLWPLPNSAVTAPHPPFEVWQLITYGFLHGSEAHLIFNMLALFMFGSDLERVWGRFRFLLYYLTCVITAAITQLLLASLSVAPAQATIGASGGVFGLLLAYGVLYPKRMIMMLIPPIPMPAWLFVIFYGVVELVLGLTGAQRGVAHFAHLGGMAGGFLLLQVWRTSLQPPAKGRKA